MKRILLFVLILNCSSVRGAVIIGSDIVCPGYIYHYSVSIPGAVSYSWTLPTGWYYLSGQGTNSIDVNCNVNASSICVTGYDSFGVPIDSGCKTLMWGGGSGWAISGYPANPCFNDYILGIYPLSGFCGTPGCGNGYKNPNVYYAVFDNPWPNGNYWGTINGPSMFGSPSQSGTLIYVYVVDMTSGNMILVEGGAGCPPQNTFYLPGFYPLEIQLSQFPRPVCTGDTFMVTSLATGGLDSQTWVGTGGIKLLINYGDSALFTAGPAGIQEINFTCIDSVFGCLYTGYLNVYAIPCATIKPAALFSSSDSTFCVESGNCVSFFDHSLNDPASWKWSFPGGTPSSSTQQNPVNICYYNTGTYAVTLIASNSLGSDTLTVSPIITVGQAKQPVLFLSGDTIYCSHASLYRWYYNGSLIPGSVDSFCVVSGDGTYSVFITDSIGCSILSGGFLITKADVRKAELLKLYPNPVKDQFTVYGIPLTVGASIELYDVLGKRVYSGLLNSKQETVNPPKDPPGRMVDCKTFSRGIYIVEVKSGERVYRAKFVKE